MVEMLIVLSIVGILTAIVIDSAAASRAKARDTRRISDMKEIQLGLAIYYDVNRAYPVGTDATALSVLASQKYIPEVPTDPQGGNYEYTGSATTYCVGVKLENTGNIPADFPSSSCTSGTPSSANYKAQPPQ